MREDEKRIERRHIWNAATDNQADLISAESHVINIETQLKYYTIVYIHTIVRRHLQN